MRILDNARCLAAAILGLALCVAAEAKPDRWLTASRDQLVVYSNLGKGAFAKELTRLEEFRLCLATLWPEQVRARERPALMIIAADGPSLDRFLPYVNDRLMSVSGLFIPSGGHNVLLIRVSRGGLAESGSHTALHEYVHELTLRGGYFPAWGAEGVAEAFAAFEKSGGGYAIGKNSALKRAVLRARTDALIPLWKMLGVEVGSVEYSNPFHQSAFYSASWLFAHYCLVSDGRRYAAAYYELIELARSRPVSSADFREIFGVSMMEMQEQLWAYLSVEETSFIEIDAKAVPKPQPFNIERASDAEIFAARYVALRRADREGEREADRVQLESIAGWRDALSSRQPLLLEMVDTAAEDLPEVGL